VLCLGVRMQNTSDHDGQIKHLVYCLENAILTSRPDNEKFVWLIDFRGWTLRKSPPFKRPLRLSTSSRIITLSASGPPSSTTPPPSSTPSGGYAQANSSLCSWCAVQRISGLWKHLYRAQGTVCIAYFICGPSCLPASPLVLSLSLRLSCPAKVLLFLCVRVTGQVIKPFVDPITYQKIKFVYSSDPSTMTVLEEAFDFDQLEKSFGGRSTWEFNFEKYSDLMRRDDIKAAACWSQA